MSNENRYKSVCTYAYMNELQCENIVYFGLYGGPAVVNHMAYIENYHHAHINIYFLFSPFQINLFCLCNTLKRIHVR